jgi:hypothetical protein
VECARLILLGVSYGSVMASFYSLVKKVGSLLSLLKDNCLKNKYCTRSSFYTN